MEFRTSGALMAGLWQHLMASKGDVEGLILGSVVVERKEAVSDAARPERAECTVTELEVFVPCSPGTLYNSVGEINLATVDRLTSGRTQAVVGWFKLRRHTPLTPSFRESVVHSGMVQALPRKQDFLFAVFSEDSALNGATHSFFYKFYQSPDGRKWHAVDIVVANLDRRHTKYEQVQRIVLAAGPKPQGPSDVLATLRQQLQLDGHRSATVTALERMHDKTLDDIARVGRDLCQAEEELARLQREAAITIQ
eukprot:m.75936 g.75936  ORF g.75936 m.75936 type:complete len:252 (-) comp17200_c0_seq3:74-829(-)